MEQSNQRITNPSMNFNSHDAVSLLHEVNLGQHTLVLMSDGSITLFANSEQALSLADNELRLDSDETYRLFICLHEQFKQCREVEAEAADVIHASSYEEPADALEGIQSRIKRETPWIVPLRIVHSPSQSLLAVRDARLGNLCTAFGSEADYELYCSLFHRYYQGGGHHDS